MQQTWRPLRRAWLSAWWIYKVRAQPVLGYVGFLAAPDEAALREETRALQRLAAGPYNAVSC